MTLSQLLERAGGVVPIEAGPAGRAFDEEVRGIEHDSRRVGRGAVFVALRGQRADGARFADAVKAHGAIAVVAETPAPEGWSSPWLVVPDARLALAHLAAAFYSHPSRALRVVGITGTNGKTTTSYLVAAVFEAAGISCGRLGTVGYRVGAEERQAPHTTPEANVVQQLLREMVDRGAGACAMEVSSHALALERVAGVDFACAVFTNLTRDHLDFHGDMEAYFQAKKRLFDLLSAGAPAVINVDDPAGRRLVANQRTALTYAIGQPADVKVDELSLTMAGVSCVLSTPRGRLTVRSPLPGRPNAYNLLAAVSTGLALGLPTEAIEHGLANVSSVPGRFQLVSAPSDGIVVIVDYAHTDDALRNVLETVRPLTQGRVIVVFGCGGDRDKTKRPLMGAVAARLADFVVLTSDNPRSEDPGAIIDDIKRGLVASPDRSQPKSGQVVTAVSARQTPWVAEPDRRLAIERAIGEAWPEDVVVIAGKGHEAYQVIGARTLPFDDAAIARELLAVRRARMKVS
ncbi:MAG: UDP-N-acetylmuramoyl-L-alanyl-D-glutamate--2,6-diaminopimelate ligase [Vicinamibacterales bacterium]